MHDFLFFSSLSNLIKIIFILKYDFGKSFLIFLLKKKKMPMRVIIKETKKK